MKDKLKKYLLPNLPYLFFVYLFDKLCQAVRLAPGLDASEKLLHIGQGFQTAFVSSAPSFHALDICVGKLKRKSFITLYLIIRFVCLFKPSDDASLYFFNQSNSVFSGSVIFPVKSISLSKME